MNGSAPGTRGFVSDGIALDSDEQAMASLAALSPGEIRVVEGDGQGAVALTGATNDADAMSVSATRLPTAASRTLTVSALDAQGRALAAGTIEFTAGAGMAMAQLSAPFELRHAFARLAIEGIGTAGSAHLLSDRFKRRRAALIEIRTEAGWAKGGQI